MSPERDRGWMIVEGNLVKPGGFLAPENFPPPVRSTTDVSSPDAAPSVLTRQEEETIMAGLQLVPELEGKLNSTAVADHLVVFLSSQGLKTFKPEHFNDVFVQAESGAPVLVYFDKEGRKGLHQPPTGQLSERAHEMRARLTKEREVLLRRGIFKTLERGGAIIVDEGFVTNISAREAGRIKAQIGEILRSNQTVGQKAESIARLLGSPVFVGRKIVEGEAARFFSQLPSEEPPGNSLQETGMSP